ncbi:GAF domain-containing protein [Brucella sp. 21LCYQ03]|nr:GAF domain-containing protein [Brucella sp. 21LCYQ03]
MLVIDSVSQRLLYASANLASLTGYNGVLIPGTDISLITGDKNAHDFRNAAAKAREPGLSSIIIGLRFPGRSTLFDAIVHSHNGNIIVEFEPAPDRGQTARQALDLTRSVIHRLGLEESVDRAATAAARLVRAMLGYDRVMVYRFLHNGAGRVIAEAKSSALSSFMGQHFPASDIPVQARRLYVNNTIRMISDTASSPVDLKPALLPDQEPVDMSFAQLRSVSPIHCQYLNNMGVSASLSISVIVDGELWGLIACHHDTPKVTPLPLRIGAELFGQYFSLHIAACERRATLQATADTRSKLDTIVSRLGVNSSMREDLISQLPEFAKLVSSHGAALWMNDQWFQTGDTLDEKTTRDLLSNIKQQAPAEIWSTSEIKAYLPDFHGSVAGMIAIPLSVTFGEYLILFRNEEAHQVEWAGEPVKTVLKTPFGERLTPRGSFDTWREDVKGRSTPWTSTDVSVARAIATYLRDVILRQNEISEKERIRTEQRRRVLNAELNHRVKNILSLVKSIARQTGMGAKNVDDYAQTLEGRLRALASAHDQSLDGTKSGFVETLVESEANLFRDNGNPDRIIVKGDPIILDQRAYSVLSLIIHEMMTNAAKYGALSTSEGQLNIEWYLEDNGDCTISWKESGGPLVVLPTRTGFGTKLIKSSFEYDLRGKVHIEHQSSGLFATFRIPATYVGSEEFRPAETPPSPASLQPQLNGISVLVVEDQSLIAMDVEDTLRVMGAQDVRLVSDTDEAITALTSFQPQIAILDFNLGSVTSEVVAEHLRDRGIPFIFMTGYSDQSSIPERFRNIEVVRKPINNDSLATKLELALR